MNSPSTAVPLLSTVAILSAMFIPALLMLTCASLVTATATRMARVVDRVRDLSVEFRQFQKTGTAQITEAEVDVFINQVRLNGRRARLLQRALQFIYLSLSFFVITSVALGFQTALGHATGWIPVILGLISAGMLLTAGVLLIVESHLGLISVHAEMNSALHLATQARR